MCVTEQTFFCLNFGFLELAEILGGSVDREIC